ncbi:MAG: FHA domain-containing protein, partial [Actinomycetota bacterium]|nr:FHA domain-containing protein [Actinomycetota bacterium]
MGRGDADLVIDDPEISRRHALIRTRDDVFEIDDLDSLNGTWVNGQRIQQTARLSHGDVVRLGKTVIAVEQGNSMAPVAETLPGPKETTAEWAMAIPPAVQGPAEVLVETGRCPECNAELPSQARFCLYCGVALGVEQSVPVPAPAPAPAPALVPDPVSPPELPLPPSSAPSFEAPS